MKITILAYGSRGDVQPFLALAIGLQRAGHDVILVAPHRFAGLVAQHRMPFAALPGDPEQMSAFANNVRHAPFDAIMAMGRYVFSIAEPVLRAAFDSCAGADLIVHSFFFTTYAHSLARERRIPDVSVQLVPLFLPTRAWPMPALSAVPPGAMSWLTHWLVTQVFRRVMHVGLARLRRSSPELLGIRPAWPFGRSSRAGSPLLFAFSQTVLPRPREWGSRDVHVPGFFFLDAPEASPSPEALQAFLANGEPPVCVTFGSMVSGESERILSLVRGALADTHRRAVILTGWGGNPPSGNARDFFVLEAAPHDWLFPRCRAVIHHGGVGTTAAALLAGIPSIIIPHGIDQKFWGKRVAAIRAGPAPIDVSRLSAEALRSALERADSPSLRTGAREAGRRIHAEDGVRAAVRLIEQHAAAFRRQGIRRPATATAAPTRAE